METADHDRQQSGSRRSFFGAMLWLGSSFVGALLAIPVLRYAFSPLTSRSANAEWTEVAPLASVSGAATPVRHTLELKRRDGWRETISRPVVYTVAAGGSVKVLSAICPHLGCTVPWDAARNEFVCPCHGGTFSADGAKLSGPPRRSLDSLETKVSGGKVLVKYQTFRPDVPSKIVTS